MCSLRMLVIDLRAKHIVSCQVTIRFHFKRLNQPHHSADTKLAVMPAVDDTIKLKPTTQKPGRQKFPRGDVRVYWIFRRTKEQTCLDALMGSV